jgi:hypothetical protein
MEKRYQVFVSSTFVDLRNERQAVMKAVLELDQMPAGMELFPAADDSAWQLIRDVIDASDYYVVIVGGRYGSSDDAGIGFTEREYDYAVQSKKPVIPLLHEKPSSLPREKTETEGEAWAKLEAFRRKLKDRHTCVYWNSTDDLKSKAIVGLTSAIKRQPRTGWVRADQVPSDVTIAEILRLRKRVEELEADSEAARLNPPKGTEDLEQGEDVFVVHMHFEAGSPDELDDEKDAHSAHIGLTWKQIFAGVAPCMIDEASEAELIGAFQAYFERRARDAFEGKKKLKWQVLDGFRFREDEIETCIVQFRALGLIRESSRQRSVRDTKTYWSLTPHGDHLMTQLRALRRAPVEQPAPEGSVTEQTMQTPIDAARD